MNAIFSPVSATWITNRSAFGRRTATRLTPSYLGDPFPQSECKKINPMGNDDCRFLPFNYVLIFSTKSPHHSYLSHDTGLDGDG